MAVCTSPGFCALPSGMFSAAQTMADDAHLRLEQGDGAHGAEHGSAAGHVVLHLLHVVGGLDGDAAGVEGDALADQAEHGAVGDAFGLIAQHDQRRRLLRSLRNAPERAHLQLFDLVGRAVLPTSGRLPAAMSAARLAELRWGELVARLVDQRAREVLAFADDDALAESGFGGGLYRLREPQR